MPRTSSRWCRAAAAALVAVGVLLGVLVCLGGGPGTGGEGPRADGPHDAVVMAAGHGEPPGCGKGSPSDQGGLRPAAPPRGYSPAELLPALYDSRVAAGEWGPDGTILDVRPERAPPNLVPPSPVGLSVLRV
ncbi:hypothetical protein ACLGI4_15495 [Streptomyces sp. HMX112]|uniref:hypothetical protein n=1 Tax=Streptomyces sp. HMX112 TaxID=3390850 RepID=UPI003A7FE6C7